MSTTFDDIVTEKRVIAAWKIVFRLRIGGGDRRKKKKSKEGKRKRELVSDTS